MQLRQTRHPEDEPVATPSPTPGLAGERLQAFGRELDALRKEVEAQIGEEDLRRVRRLDGISRSLEVTGRVLIHYDGELNQPSYLPQGSSPAAFLLRDRISLSGDVKVTKVERKGNQLLVDVAQTGDEEKGALHLVFTDEPLALRQWVVTDAAGKKTEVTLVDPKFNLAIDPVKFLFETPAPRSGTPQQ